MRKLIIFVGLALILTGCMVPKQPSTWSIVAADPATGEVGVASASCVPVAIDALASLVPGHGVAASQAAFDVSNRDRVFTLLQDEMSADDIIATVTGDDDGSATRQYGVITIGDGNGQAAGFTGSENGDWAGDKQDSSRLLVTVQGNILEGEGVVQDALDAFLDESLGPVTLSDRLIRALEAGSAAGGDTRCNQVIQQTASAAFIMVAQGDEEPFAAPDFGQSSQVSDNSPSLYLSVSGLVGGANPIVELREQYDQWRQVELPSCIDCDLAALEVPPGGGLLTSILGMILFVVPAWLALVFGVAFMLILYFLVRFFSQRKSRA